MNIGPLVSFKWKERRMSKLKFAILFISLILAFVYLPYVLEKIKKLCDGYQQSIIYIAIALQPPEGCFQ